MLLVDSSAWVEILLGSTVKGMKAKELVASEPVFTASISLAEISYWCYCNKRQPEEDLALVRNTSEGLLQTRPAIEKRAGQLKFELNNSLGIRGREIGLIDCLIMAVGEESVLSILTTDKHFLKYSGKTILL